MTIIWEIIADNEDLFQNQNIKILKIKNMIDNYKISILNQF